MRPRTFRRYSWSRHALVGLALLVASLQLAQAQTVAAPAAATANPVDPVDAAIALARSRHQPVLAWFHAMDCDACYYAEQHVHSSVEWKEAGEHAVVISLDADSPGGNHWQQQWQIHRLPTAIVLDEQGHELGRIVGAQTHAEYFHRLHDLLTRTVAVDDLPAHITDVRAPSIAAAREWLAALYARDDAGRALRWWDALPATLRTSLEHDHPIQAWIARLKLLQASQADSAPQCVAAAPPVFASDLGCDRPLEVQRVLNCTTDMPQAETQKLLGAQKVQLAQFVYSRAFVGKRSCADGRAAVLAVAELDHRLGYPRAAVAMLDAAIDDAKHRLHGDLHKDRALADDLRVYLDHAGRLDDLDALYPKLIAAYPNDPVYEYRYAQSLVARGRPEQAISHFERAAPLAQGLNRLVIAQSWAQTLIKLGRAEQARSAVDDSIKAVGPWFPEQAAKLRAIVTTN
jgi:tetratricopeptide (TPR) repeat protein